MFNKAFLFLIVFSLSFGFQAQVQSAEHGDMQDTITHATTKKLENVGNKICPVSGDKIIEETKSTIEYKGKVYNLCCPACIDEFKKDPDKYIKKVNEELQPQEKEETKQKETMPEAGMPMSGHEMHH